MTGTYGITITGNVAVITLSVPALWWLAVTVMAGVFLTWTTVRDWIGGVLARVWLEDKQPHAIDGDKIHTKWNVITAKGPTNSGGARTWE